MSNIHNCSSHLVTLFEDDSVPLFANVCIYYFGFPGLEAILRLMSETPCCFSSVPKSADTNETTRVLFNMNCQNIQLLLNEYYFKRNKHHDHKNYTVSEKQKCSPNFNFKRNHLCLILVVFAYLPEYEQINKILSALKPGTQMELIVEKTGGQENLRYCALKVQSHQIFQFILESMNLNQYFL
jgi:hypothetical protein